MLNNLAFTLYEIFGYLLPGGVASLAFLVIFWTLFVPTIPLGIATFQPGLVTWVSISVASYLLGHAVQAVANKFLRGVEDSMLDVEKGTEPKWMRDRSQQLTREILRLSSEDEVQPKWICRALDEYALQNGEEGDRDIYIYREGFYRGTSIALFFLALSIVFRSVVPGGAIQFTKWLFPLAWSELLLLAFVVAALGVGFLKRYRRFAEYRISRAILAALIVAPKPPESTVTGHK